MMFKDLKQNDTVYVLNTKCVKLNAVKIQEISVPHIDTYSNNPTEMVIDITLDIDGHKKSFTVKDRAKQGFGGDCLISIDKDCILQKVRDIKQQSEEILDKIEIYKDTVCKCSDILNRYDPVYKERQKSEERICNLENSIKELKDTIKLLVNKTNEDN